MEINFKYSDKIEKILSQSQTIRYERRLEVLEKRIEQLIHSNYQLKTNKLKSIKYKHQEYYVYRLTKSIRIFFTLQKIGIHQVISHILSIVDHNTSDKLHQNSDLLNNLWSKIDTETLTEQDKLTIKNNINLSKINYTFDKFEKNKIHKTKGKIFQTRWDLSQNQNAILNQFIEEPNPIILRGYAGSGKTSITYELIFKLYDKLNTDKQSANILYLTLSKNLTKKSIDFFKNYNLNIKSNQLPHQQNSSAIRIDFYDFESLITDIKTQRNNNTINYSSSKFISQQKFTNDFFKSRSADSIFKNQPARFWSELRGVLKNTSNGNITQIEYDKITNIDSNYDEKSKGKVLNLLKQYDKWLKDNNYYDEMDILSNMIQNWHDNILKYDYIIVDEVQDFTQLHILFLIKLMNSDLNHHALFLAGDEHQIIYPSGFRWDRLKDLLFKEINAKCKIQELLDNYRSHQNIINVVNQISDFRYKYGLITEKSKREKINAILNENNTDLIGKGDVTFIEKIHLNNTLKQQEIDSVDVVILVVDEHHKIKLIENYPYLKNKAHILNTITEFKGLDAKHIFIIDFFSYTAILDSHSNGMTSLDLLQKIVRSSQNSYMSNYIYEATHCLNLLTVAVTRAKENLYIIEDTFQEQQKSLFQELLGIDFAHKNDIVENINRIFEHQSSVEEFIARAQQYIEQENFSAAKDSFKAAEKGNYNEQLQITIELGLLHCEAELATNEKFDKWIHYAEATRQHGFYQDAAQIYQLVLRDYQELAEQQGCVLKAILCYFEDNSEIAHMNIQKLLDKYHLRYDDLIKLVNQLELQDNKLISYSSALTRLYAQYIEQHIQKLSELPKISFMEIK